MELRLEDRTVIFLQELKRCEVTVIHFQMSVIPMVGGIYLNTGTSFFSDGVKYINHIYAKKLETNAEDEARLNQGSGTLSDKLRRTVEKKMRKLVREMHDHKIEVSSLTYGRGLLYLDSATDFKESIDEENGSNKKICWIHATNHM
jgi:hypothetical protein